MTDPQDYAQAAGTQHKAVEFAGIIDKIGPGPDDKIGPGPEEPSRLPIILETLRDTEWMTYLRHWRRLRSESEPVTRPESFYGEAFNRDVAAPGQPRPTLQPTAVPGAA